MTNATPFFVWRSILNFLKWDKDEISDMGSK